jgi:hypothetical protein
MKAFIDPITSITASSLQCFVKPEQDLYPHIVMIEVIRVKQIVPGDIVCLFFCVIDLSASRLHTKLPSALENLQSF